MSYLLLHSSTDGQTKKIILKMAEQLRSLGRECDIRDLNTDQSFNLSAYDKVMVGASIRYGHFNKKLLGFATSHQSQLNSMKTAFFAVNLTARKEGKNTAETNTYTRKFLEKCPWQPTLKSVFAGALYYPRYKWLDRTMIRLIMKMTDGPTDPNTEVEYTNWENVALFTTEFDKS
ncbi:MULTISPECIES: menaquinone-dependent protoporphyrinogen IX dehydrogenase [Providencia]|uniref:Protoporphyrinogen IX dehydrogenase [quinone] n=1 Tax=Providencia heimbachae ATCC 35613 TaxID=1354272 RepID=A0A1B7JRK8_9GAMM|nr:MULTISPECIES: menaquinone-dependent protoporphyrinogen IX dehydrogenase [Providencia]MBP6122297.1 menaquinone-dependent protoporphyrinogen IX dehydrogenase [Providencia sp.]MDD9338476.1 menaquinone-dependent protoporphyrinogen IX dehydrogenase [Providencia heimbachae]NIH21290.1 menaquinone-dependent protoporphyrinogen IX dehydrogenase [Providencia heimbachae]OAT50537.1 oxygen-independent protoporphyrinogen IX oxidase [Providencia heimbachae ATCC 35613]QCJ68896.1 menaquinone-dependent protop